MMQRTQPRYIPVRTAARTARGTNPQARNRSSCLPAWRTGLVIQANLTARFQPIEVPFYRKRR